MTDDRLGEVRRDGDRLSLRFERRLAHPPEKVWRALTESEHLRHWLPCDIVGERRAGAAVTLPFWQPLVEAHDIAEPVLAGEIRAWDPPRVFEWTWGGDVLRWELTPSPGGTVLVFTTWLGDESAQATTGTAAGYHVCLDQLRELLDTGATQQHLAEADMTPVERRYAELVASAE